MPPLVQSRTYLAKPKRSQQIVRWSQNQDSFRRYVTDSPSPDKFAAILKGVDSGNLADLCRLQEEMEARSPHFQGVCNQRRESLAGLEYSIEPDEHAKDQAAAQEAADFVAEHLAAMQKPGKDFLTFTEALDYLGQAIGPNVSVVENIWEKGLLSTFVPVPSNRLTMHPFENNGVYVVTDEEILGVPTDIPTKFIVYHPKNKGWHPFRKTLTHASALPYLLCHFSIADWGSFNELYGTPIRTAKYDDAVVGADRDTVMEWLEQMSADSAAALPAGIDVALLHAEGKGETFQAMIDWAERKLAILWLGQTLTTDVGDSGSRALGQVHENVRMDILSADIRGEAECLREYLFRPMVELRFPGRDMPIPVFRRKLVTKRDADGERLDLDQLRAAKEFGLPIDEDQAYEKLRLMRPTGKVLVYPTPEPKEGPPDAKDKQDAESPA